MLLNFLILFLTIFFREWYGRNFNLLWMDFKSTLLKPFSRQKKTTTPTTQNEDVLWNKQHHVKTLWIKIVLDCYYIIDDFYSRRLNFLFNFNVWLLYIKLFNGSVFVDIWKSCFPAPSNFHASGKKVFCLFHASVCFISEFKQNPLETISPDNSQPKLLGSRECCWEQYFLIIHSNVVRSVCLEVYF